MKVEFDIPDNRFVAHGVAVIVSIDEDGKSYVNVASVGNPPAWTRAELHRAGLRRADQQLDRSWEGA